MSQSIVRPPRRWDPERIGPYAIIGRLGAGAMGQVFLARSAAGRLVAVKTIRVELAEEPGFRARFAREVAAARRVSGVFTAAVIEADADADLPWVATAYVPAPSLAALVRRCGPLPVPALRWLAAGCAEALQSIHGAGLLHRDVKPSNVLVAPDGPRVIDFGVARAAERVQLTATRGAAGTPAYMAPEQARDAVQASPASDVFSLGATLLFAATGHPPYRGETAMDILVRLATEPPDLSGLPDELSGLVTACLQRVPRDRPTGAAILAELGQLALPAGPGHPRLPGSAMALIAEYQRDPPSAAAGEGSWPGGAEDLAGGGTDGSSVPVTGDDTSGSHTALPGFESPGVFRAGQGEPAGGDGPGPPPRRAGRPGRDPGQGRRPGARARAAPGRRPLARRGWAAVALVLAGAGAGIGIGIGLRGPGAYAANSGGQPPAGPPPSCLAPGGSSAPQLCVNQPYGDGDTVFVIHGSGFAPFTRVTIRLAGVGVAADAPRTDGQGTFSYAIDQGHVFFPGPIPEGTYRVVASAPGGTTVSASFRVGSFRGGPPPGPP